MSKRKATDELTIPRTEFERIHNDLQQVVDELYETSMKLQNAEKMLRSNAVYINHLEKLQKIGPHAPKLVAYPLVRN